MNMLPPFILGSGSPRRAEILSYFSLSFKQIASNFDEDSLLYAGDPVAYVVDLAEGKAQTLALQFPDTPILTADTIVYKEGKLYGKPKTEEEGVQFLKELSGGKHTVYTALCLQQGEKIWKECTQTDVYFLPMTEEQIHAYHARTHCWDKAGGYAIQEAGSMIIEKIEGCFYNVMGLPIQPLIQLLGQVGINLWHHSSVV